jgi:hypothetical protein
MVTENFKKPSISFSVAGNSCGKERKGIFRFPFRDADPPYSRRVLSSRRSKVSIFLHQGSATAWRKRQRLCGRSKTTMEDNRLMTR